MCPSFRQPEVRRLTTRLAGFLPGACGSAHGDPAIVNSDNRLRADQRPLYVQASEAVRQLLRSGGYTPGDRLQSEIERSQQLGISRPTLREALRLLEDEGAILRRHGVGTFMAAPRPVIEGGLEVLESIERLAERRGLHTRMDKLAVAERPATPAELEHLALSAEAAVTVVTRVIVTGTQRIAYLADMVPVEYLRRADLDRRFKGSVLDLFLARGFPALAHSRTELAAEAADVEMAQRLHLARGAPLLKLSAELFAADGRVVDYSLSYLVTSYLRFHVIRRIG
jgi:GntR family transcriptional regulator